MTSKGNVQFEDEEANEIWKPFSKYKDCCFQDLDGFKQAALEMNKISGDHPVYRAGVENARYKDSVNKYACIGCIVPNCWFNIVFDYEMDAQGNHINISFRKQLGRHHLAEQHMAYYDKKVSEEMALSN